MEIEAHKQQPPPGLRIFDGPSLRTEAKKALSKQDKAKLQQVKASLPDPLDPAALEVA